MAFPGWPQPSQGDKKKKKKRKKKDRAASSSSSSSSSSEENWQHKVWSQGWPAAMGGMWPAMQGNPAAAAMWGGWPPNAHQMAGGPGAQAYGLQPPLAVPGEDRHWGGNSWGNDRRNRDSRSQREEPSGFDGWGKGDNRGSKHEEPDDDEVPIFLEPAIEEFVPVPKALLGKVIGKQAQTIIEIKHKSGAFKVDARDQTSDPCQVKIAGTAEAVRKARVLIMEVLDSTKTQHTDSDFVEVPRAKIGMVIGLKGSQVNEIQQQTGTKIDVDFATDPCKCFIKGDADAVSRAKKVLLTIAMQIEDENSEYVELPKATSGAVIGAAGSRIREFQEQSGARIDVDKTGTTCRVRFTGTNEQIANAKQLILAEVEHAVQPSRPSGPSYRDQAPMVIPAHQPTSFPATLSESIARAKAAAEAVKNGLITTAPSEAASQQPSLGPPSRPSWEPAPPPQAMAPPRSAAGGQQWGSGNQHWGSGNQPYRPW